MQRDLRTMQYLAAMPFLDRLELAAVSNTADRTMHDVVADLKDRDLVASIRHSTDLIASTRRLYVTRMGLRWLAEQEDEDVLELLQRYPVSRHWQRILLERLDAVGVIYRLASHVPRLEGLSASSGTGALLSTPACSCRTVGPSASCGRELLLTGRVSRRGCGDCWRPVSRDPTPCW